LYGGKKAPDRNYGDSLFGPGGRRGREGSDRLGAGKGKMKRAVADMGHVYLKLPKRGLAYERGEGGKKGRRWKGRKITMRRTLNLVVGVRVR